MAVQHGLCKSDQLGLFIVDESMGPTYTIKQKQFDFQNGSNESAVFTYNVTSSGYYCVGATSLSVGSEVTQAEKSHFSGHVDFHNKFHGNLPASEYPKLNFYGVMTLVYLVVGAMWITLCVIHRDQIVMVQHFVSAMIAFMVIEMACEWLSYTYYNSHVIDLTQFVALDGKASVTTMSRFFLILTSILGAARDSLSFFLLLIVAMGYGVVRPTIGPVLRQVQLLTGLHFVFGVLYSVGVILILLEIGGTWIFLFIFPLAGTLTAFLMWILFSLKATIRYLTERRQTFKRSMFQRLYIILMAAVVAVFGFFFFTTFLVVSTGPSELNSSSWEYRWFLLDGSLSLLYFIGTCSVLITSFYVDCICLEANRSKHASRYVG